MQLGERQKPALASSQPLSASCYLRARMWGQFLIANLELEFNLNIPESTTCNFLIANKMRFFNPQVSALQSNSSSFPPRASSL